MKKLLLLNIILFATLFASAEVLLVEDFEYTVGLPLSSCGWQTNYSNGVSGTSISNGLEFCGYMGSGIGNGALSSGKDSNAQPQKTFTQQTSGSVYVAFMLQPYYSPKGGYFMFLRDAVSSTEWDNMDGCVLLNAENQIGLSFNSGTTNAIYASTSLDNEKTYLVVLKYTIIDGAKNDKVELFVLDHFVDAEPTTPILSAENSSAGANRDINPGVVGLRSFSDDAWISIDGIRVATTWAEAVASNGETCETAVKQITSGANVYSSHGKLFISLATDEQVNIFDATGKCVYRENIQAGEHLFNLHKGFYVVRIGNKAQKIVVD